MKRLSTILLLLCNSAGAIAAGRLADVSVIDRDSGAALATHYDRGEYWVAGRPGTRYAVRITNRSGGRLLAVTAVDGINAISGETAAFGQTGYVFEPWQHYDIAGWRKSDAEVAAFVFTDAPSSYAARTGRPFNVGVIGVALFRERVLEPQSAAQEQAPRVAADAQRPVDSPAPTAASPPAARAESSSGGRADRRAALQNQLGTGHGEREYSSVRRTDFQRRGSQPDEIIRIRYDSRDNLVAMGVIPHGASRSPAPDAFPDSPLARYVPDPPPLR